jgi:hypothetical protein
MTVQQLLGGRPVRRGISTALGVVLVGAVAAGCGGGGAAAPVVTTTTTTAAGGGVTTTTAPPNQVPVASCGAKRSPFDPTLTPPPANSPARCL